MATHHPDVVSVLVPRPRRSDLRPLARSRRVLSVVALMVTASLPAAWATMTLKRSVMEHSTAANTGNAGGGTNGGSARASHDHSRVARGATSSVTALGTLDPGSWNHFITNYQSAGQPWNVGA